MPPVPAAPDPLVALADRCVQCGLCLPHCPTYALTQSEAESPRGRIAIVRALALGTLPAEPDSDTPLDHCLGCRRCEAVCPAQVPYGAILLETRTRRRRRRGADLRQRALEWLCAHPSLLARLLRGAGALAPLLPRSWQRRLPAAATAPLRPDARDDTVAVFAGCVARAFDGELDTSLHRLLHAVGLAPQYPPGQTCCGALHAHAGNRRDAQVLAARNRAAFAGHDTVLTTASGCHATLAAALSPPSQVRDALDLLADRAPALRFRPAGVTLAVHLPCTQANVASLRRLLARVPELTLVELHGMGCCGAAGTHMLDHPARAGRLRQPLLDQAQAAGARIMVSVNIGCRLHLAAGSSDIEVVHPLVFLARHLI